MRPYLIAFLLLLASSHTPLNAQGFEPLTADTAKIRADWEANQYRYSEGYLYLKKYYGSAAKRDSVHYLYPSDEEPCAFVEAFKQGIEYRLLNCDEEGGTEERLRFPRMELKQAQKFINHLFYNQENKWKDGHHYGPEGAGCYYHILQSDDFTEIRIWCGC